MKKLCAMLLLACMTALGAMAQTSPDRILVRETSGDIRGFLADRVDSIFFASIDGPVAADIDILSVDEKDQVIKLSVTRTEDCVGFRICLFPPSAESYIADPEVAIRYIDMFGSEIYYQDFVDAEMSGFEEKFAPGAVYNLVTVGYDPYGIACDVRSASFTTTKPDVTGHPEVACEVLSVTQTDFTIKFTPNKDVKNYFYCSFEKGTFEQQFEMWKGMFGLNTPDEMIQQFCGGAIYGVNTNIWKAMTPGTDYEVYVAIVDMKGNFAERTKVEVTTTNFGGSGDASVSIRIKEFEYNAEAGEYTQVVVFTPNDQTSMFRDMLLEKAAYESGDWTEEKIIEYLQSDPYDGLNPYWNLYREDEYPWVVSPSTTYIAYAIAMNGDGVWGSLCQLEFTTPEGNGDTPVVPTPKRAPKLATETAIKAVPMTMAPKSARGVQLIQK